MTPAIEQGASSLPGDRRTAGIVGDIIRGRRTIEKFREVCPPRELLLEAIDVACWAPNHHHTEPWKFHLLGEATAARMIDLNTAFVLEHKREEAARNKRRRWEAVPGWLAVTCELADDPLTREEDYAACCCAIQNLSLYLWSLGIGTKWSTGAVTRQPDFAELLGIDSSQRRVVGLLSYGYPLVIPESRRKPVSEVIDELP